MENKDSISTVRDLVQKLMVNRDLIADWESIDVPVDFEGISLMNKESKESTDGKKQA